MNDLALTQGGKHQPLQKFRLPLKSRTCCGVVDPFSFPFFTFKKKMYGGWEVSMRLGAYEEGQCVRYEVTVDNGREDLLLMPPSTQRLLTTGRCSQNHLLVLDH